MPTPPGQGGIGSQTSTMDEQAVASQLGLTVDQVVQFCQSKGIAKAEDHYAIPTSYLDELRNWAKGGGFTSGR